MRRQSLSTNTVVRAPEDTLIALGRKLFALGASASVVEKLAPGRFTQEEVQRLRAGKVYLGIGEEVWNLH